MAAPTEAEIERVWEESGVQRIPGHDMTNECRLAARVIRLEAELAKYRPTKLHLYDGSIAQTSLCETCGGPAKNGQHFTNGGVVCDNPDGACSCGAWHSGLSELEARAKKGG